MLPLCTTAQGTAVDSAMQEIVKFQKELNEEYSSPKDSPLEPRDRKKFKGLPFFPADLKYRIAATLKLTPETPYFEMKTTIPRANLERIFGMLNFQIDGKEYSLPVYQSKSLQTQAGYEDYLFFPFTDLTNGTETYGGGRYMDLRIPRSGSEIVLDFNKAYNPYCAYSKRFSCPIVPKENHIDAEIRAGVMLVER